MLIYNQAGISLYHQDCATLDIEPVDVMITGTNSRKCLTG